MLSDYIIDYDDLILITGSNGFIGSKVVETLLNNGFRNLRCFVRPASNLSKLENALMRRDEAKIDICQGNLLSIEDATRAADGVALIYHLAAGSEKTFPGCFMNAAVTTKNLLEGSLKNSSLKRFLNVSSFAVYSNMKIKRGGLLDENCETETRFMERADGYCYGKAKQDEILLECGRKHNIPYVIVRPGAVYGPGTRQIMPPRVGSGTFGIFMHVLGPHKIPFTYLDNCAEAIVLTGLKQGIDGETFNIVDDDLPTSREFLRQYKRKVGSFFSIYFPYRLFYVFCFLWEKYSKWSEEQLPPAFNRRKCAALFKGNRYSNSKLKRLVGWKPKISFAEGSLHYFQYLKSIGGYK